MKVKMGGRRKSSVKTGSAVNPDFTPLPYKKQGYKNFDEFFPFYLGEHSNTVNRRLHIVSTTNAFLIVIFALFTTRYYLLFFPAVQAYACNWVGHFYFERNTPATFSHPFYSLMGDLRLWYEVVTGLRSF